jgi:putative flippase GtrA
MHALIVRLLGTRLGRLAFQFGKFGLVGIVGLMVDVAVVWLCIRQLGIDPFSSRIVSYLCAATTTWALNRVFTFRDAAHDGIFRQWLTFLAANAVGGVVNYGTYAALVAATVFFHDYPEAATAIGSLAGMLFNFTASKKFVFKAG